MSSALHQAIGPTAVTAVVAAAFVFSLYRRPAPPLWAAVVVGAVTRVVFAAMTSKQYTPRDVRVYFQNTGRLVLHGHEPLEHLPGRQWNFLEVMPYIHALEIKTGAMWVYAVKIAPILADLVLIWLVSVIAGADGRARALQYALNPVSLFVVSLHGQVEPVALALGLAGLILARREKWLLAGIFLGAAVAAKTWPIIIAAAVAPWTRARKLAEFTVGGAIVPGVTLLSAVLFLDTKPVRDLKHIASYSSFVGRWGWATLLDDLPIKDTGGYGSRFGHPGSLFTALVVIAAIILLRHRTVEERALAALAGALVVSAGFGVQYLLWVLPLAAAISAPAALAGYVIAATFYCGLFYLRVLRPSVNGYLDGLSWLVIYLLAALVYDVWRRRSGIIKRSPSPVEVSA